MSLTVVLTNYLRTPHLHRVVDGLLKQTVRPTIFVWDNSPKQDFDDPRVSWIIRSSRNAQCAPRWWMAGHAKTDFVLIHDDDLMATDSRVLAWTLESASKAAPFGVGATGVILKEGKGYWESRHVGLRSGHATADTHVDILKGCYFCAPTEELASLECLALEEEDDIAVSARLGKKIVRPHLVAAQLQEYVKFIPQGNEARKFRKEHRAARDAARWRWFGTRESDARAWTGHSVHAL